METLIVLLKDWEHDGETYKKGARLETDKKFADKLVEDGVAELVEKSAKASKVKQAEDADTKSVTAEDVEAIVTAAIKKVAKDPVNSVRGSVVKENVEDDPKLGYKYFGDFVSDVMKAGMPNATTPKALRPTMVTKAVGSDEYTTVEDSLGGFLIPPEYRQEMLSKGIEPDIARSNGARQLLVGSTMTTINALTDTDRQTSLYGGILTYFQSERSQMTASKGEFEQIELKPKMLTAMYFVTDNELHHVPQLGGFLAQNFQDAITFKENDVFINGLGAGLPLGILNAPCVYSQAKETNQAAATIVTENVLGMRSHMRDAEYQNSVWLASQSCMSQLNLLTIDVGTGGAPVALMNIGADGVTRLLGRPILYNEFCQAIGTVGDLILVSWPSYLIAETSYRRIDSSIHIRFDYNETAFRVVKTVDGQPWWRSTLTLKNAWEVAPIVTLAARA